MKVILARILELELKVDKYLDLQTNNEQWKQVSQGSVLLLYPKVVRSTEKIAVHPDQL